MPNIKTKRERVNVKKQSPKFDVTFVFILFRIIYSRQSEEPKKNSVGIFEYILASMLKVFLNM